jgi:hypothetical protein
MPFTGHSVEELRKWIGRDHGSRVKFATKIFHALTFVKAHATDVVTVGVCWCADGIHFLCNSAILACFLDLRANSINTNFRDHGFEITRLSKVELIDEFPHLPSLNNWKKRRHRDCLFTASSTLEDVERITCVDILKPSQDVPAQTMPDEILRFSQQDPVVAARTLTLWEKICNPVDIFNYAYEDWKQIGGPNCTTDLENLTSILIRRLDSQRGALQIKENIEALVRYNDDEDWDRGDLRFDEYVMFCCRYGFLRGAIDVILQLTDPSQVGPVHFHSWFQPFLGPHSARVVLAEKSSAVWFVRLTNMPGVFALEYRIAVDGTRPAEHVVAYVKFDPLHSDQLLSIRNGDQLITATDWQNLLYVALNLDSTLCLVSQPITPVRQTDGAEMIEFASSQRETVRHVLVPPLAPRWRKIGFKSAPV